MRDHQNLSQAARALLRGSIGSESAILGHPRVERLCAYQPSVESLDRLPALRRTAIPSRNSLRSRATGPRLLRQGRQRNRQAPPRPEREKPSPSPCRSRQPARKSLCRLPAQASPAPPRPSPSRTRNSRSVHHAAALGFGKSPHSPKGTTALPRGCASIAPEAARPTAETHSAPSAFSTQRFRWGCKLRAASAFPRQAASCIQLQGSRLKRLRLRTAPKQKAPLPAKPNQNKPDLS